MADKKNEDTNDYQDWRDARIAEANKNGDTTQPDAVTIAVTGIPADDSSGSK